VSELQGELKSEMKHSRAADSDAHVGIQSRDAASSSVPFSQSYSSYRVLSGFIFFVVGAWVWYSHRHSCILHITKEYQCCRFRVRVGIMVKLVLM